MKFREVMAGAAFRGEGAPLPGDTEVTGLEYDSRRVEKGFLFFAFPGTKADGRNFAQDAVARGAHAVVSELPRPE